MPPYVVAGFHKVRGELSAIGSLAFGCADATVENFNGAQLPTTFGNDMCIVKTYRECEPTYYETTSRGTRVNYICLSQSKSPVLTRCYVHPSRAIAVGHLSRVATAHSVVNGFSTLLMLCKELMGRPTVTSNSSTLPKAQESSDGTPADITAASSQTSSQGNPCKIFDV